jgi:fumarylacetoacetate (FAA) hydrolase
VAVTPDELGDKWKGGRVHLELRCEVNGTLLGHPNAGRDATFGLNELIAHAAKTRDLAAGTMIGTGTISNQDLSVGYACLMEKRLVEQVEQGEAKTPFLRFGDRVRIEMRDAAGETIFGDIDHKVEKL